MEKRLAGIRDHFIVCGFGRIGKVICKELKKNNRQFVVIENDPEEMRVLEEKDYLALQGDSSDDDILMKAHVKSAKGLIAVVSTDADNVFLVLIAKQINPELLIVGRASQNATKKTLSAAGADKVISPYELGARRMAHAILRPTVIKFLEMAFADDSVDIQVEEIRIGPRSRFAGQSMMESGIRKDFDLIIIVIRKPDDQMVFNPTANTIIEAEDVMVVVGSARDIRRFEHSS